MMMFKKDPGRDPTSAGNIALEMGFVTQSEMDEALRMQHECGEKLCALLVSTGHLEQWKADEVLAIQRQKRAGRKDRASVALLRAQGGAARASRMLQEQGDMAAAALRHIKAHT